MYLVKLPDWWAKGFGYKIPCYGRTYWTRDVYNDLYAVITLVGQKLIPFKLADLELVGVLT